MEYWNSKLFGMKIIADFSNQKRKQITAEFEKHFGIKNKAENNNGKNTKS